MKITIDLRQDALMAHLSMFPDRLATSIVRAMRRATIGLQGYVKSGKLSGQVLHVQTGTLRRSINQEVRYAGGGLIEGVVGTNVEYAAINEYGGTVAVSTHIRQLRERGKMTLFKTSKSKDFGVWKNVRGKKTGVNATVSGASSKTQFFTRAGASMFLRHVPERSFLRSALKEYQPIVNIELQRALLEAFKK